MVEHLLALRKKERYSGLHSATKRTKALTPYCTQEKKRIVLDYTVQQDAQQL